MNDPTTETLFLDDRTDWAPQWRWHADRRGAFTVLATLTVFTALLGAALQREARATPRVARVTAPRRPWVLVAAHPCSRENVRGRARWTVPPGPRGDTVRRHVVGP